MNSKVEETLAAYLKFRVTMVGNRKLEFLHYYGEGDDAMLRVKSTRPATQQECEMWDHMLGLAEQLDGAKEFLPGGGGVPAEEVRDSLGNPRE